MKLLYSVGTRFGVVLIHHVDVLICINELELHVVLLLLVGAIRQRKILNGWIIEFVGMSYRRLRVPMQLAKDLPYNFLDGSRLVYMTFVCFDTCLLFFWRNEFLLKAVDGLYIQCYESTQITYLFFATPMKLCEIVFVHSASL